MKSKRIAGARQATTVTHRKQADRYVERYDIGTGFFGIEDYQKPGDHFFPDKPHRRFRSWYNGCGIGQSDTIKEARKIIFDFVIRDLARSFDYAFETFSKNVMILDKLGDEPDVTKLHKFLRR